MDVTEQLRTWGEVHARARSAEDTARRSGDGLRSGDLWREAKSLRERADRLHREIYQQFGRRQADQPR